MLAVEQNRATRLEASWLQRGPQQYFYLPPHHLQHFLTPNKQLTRAECVLRAGHSSEYIICVVSLISQELYEEGASVIPSV